MHAFAFVLPLLSLTAGADAPSEVVSSRPLGTWERVAGDVTITLTIKTDSIRMTTAEKQPPAKAFQFDADYSVTRDGIVFGIVSGFEEKGESAVPTNLEDLFRFRFRVDDGILTVKDLKGLHRQSRGGLLEGRWRSASTAPTTQPVTEDRIPSAVPPPPMPPATSYYPRSQPNPPARSSPR